MTWRALRPQVSHGTSHSARLMPAAMASLAPTPVRAAPAAAASRCMRTHRAASRSARGSRAALAPRDGALETEPEAEAGARRRVLLSGGAAAILLLTGASHALDVNVFFKHCCAFFLVFWSRSKTMDNIPQQAARERWRRTTRLPRSPPRWWRLPSPPRAARPLPLPSPHHQSRTKTSPAATRPRRAPLPPAAAYAPGSESVRGLVPRLSACADEDRCA